MRKFIWLIAGLIAMALTSCGSYYIVKADYEVCYIDGTRQYTKEIEVFSKSKPVVICYSVNGTNYISAADWELNVYGEKEVKKFNHFESTTAQMRLIDRQVTKIKKKKEYDL